MHTIFNDIVCFKQEDMHRIYGTYPGNYEVVRVHGSVGPVGPRAIVQSGDQCFFLAKSGLCVYDGVSAKSLGDRRLREFFQNLNPAKLGKACMAAFGDKVLVAVAEKGQAENNAIVEWDLRRDVYMIRRGIRADCFLVSEDSLLFGNDTGYVYAYGEGETYDGMPIEAYWRTPWTDMGWMDARKYFAELFVFGEGCVDVEHETERVRKQKRVPLRQGRRTRAMLSNRGRRMRLMFRNVAGARFRLEGGFEWRLEMDE